MIGLLYIIIILLLFSIRIYFSLSKVTADGQRSSQFEHTLVITEGGYEVLTGRLANSPALDFNVGLL